MALPDRDKMCSLLEAPLQLFAELYPAVEERYNIISNGIYTAPQAEKRFDELSKYFTDNLRRIYSAPSHKGLLDGLKRTIQRETAGDLLCLSLLRGLAEYLAGRSGALSRMKPLQVGDFFISLTPPNPIYDAVPNPIRESMGTGMKDIEVFRKISVIQQGALKTSPVVSSVLDRTNNYLSRLDGSFSIAVSPFMKNLAFQFGSLLADWPAGKKTPFWFQGIANLKEAEEFLVARILEPCLDQGVTVLVLPELVIDEAILAFLRQWIRTHNRERVSSGGKGILLLVAGSFHRSDADGKTYNISTVLNHAGELIWQQKKMQRFSFDAKDLKSSPHLKELLRTSDAGGYEKIELDDTIVCADTPIGRICVSICIDCLHDDNVEAYRKTGVNLFLIPAMTPSNSRFAGAAKLRGSSNLAASFFANSRYIAKEQKGASFYYIPNSKDSFHYAGDGQDLLVFDIDLIDG